VPRVLPSEPTRPTIAPPLAIWVPSVHPTVYFLLLSCSVLTLDLLMLACGILASLGPRSVYKDMLNNKVSPNDHVVMNHQNQTRTNGIWGYIRYNLPLLVIYDNTTKASINLQKLTEFRTTYTCLDAYHHPKLPLDQPSPFFIFSSYVHILPLWSHILGTTSLLLPTLEPLACFGLTFSPFGIKSPKSPKQKGSKETSKS
jgi:hypothetical protein